MVKVKNVTNEEVIIEMPLGQLTVIEPNQIIDIPNCVFYDKNKLELVIETKVKIKKKGD